MARAIGKFKRQKISGVTKKFIKCRVAKQESISAKVSIHTP